MPESLRAARLDAAIVLHELVQATGVALTEDGKCPGDRLARVCPVA
jgi:hypothetical protein